MDSIAFRYAQALGQLAQETNQVKPWQLYMKQVHQLMNEEKDLIVFLSHNEIPKEAKHQLVRTIFNDAPVSVLHFLLLLIDRKRIQYLESIAIEFHHLCNTYQGIQEGVIHTAIDLTSEQIVALQTKLSQQLQSQLDLKVQKDTTLLGGFKVVIGDRVYDNSLLHQLSELRHTIMQGKR